MSQRARCLVVAAFALMAAFAGTAASAGEPVTPKLGLFYGQVVGPAEGGSVEVHETEVKVVKVGKGRGAQVRMSSFLCTGDQTPPGTGFSVLEKSPIPIEDGKFKRDRTLRNVRIASGAGTATTRLVLLGTFKSSTKVVVKAFVSSSFRVQFPGQPETKGMCTGRQTGVAKHQ